MKLKMLAVKMIYPYLVAEMIRLVFLLAAHISGMMLIKENIFELGILIYSTLTGFFLLLYLFYGWTCVLSLSQCLLQIGKQLKSTNDRPSSLSVPVNRLSDMKIINYDNFLLPTISNAIGGQDFPSFNSCATHRNTSLITPYCRW
ncbi:uncharacterized protein isoform X2 [Rhodnius prolixus]|uniref:uncharacterized protein isoform X2 n=1 Tax=Rhodnius prolixus TaxID=13249 RepID=UPI003D187DDD